MKKQFKPIKALNYKITRFDGVLARSIQIILF